MAGKRKHLTRAGNQLRHLIDHPDAMKDLTEEEIELAMMLRDRFFFLANRIPRHQSKNHETS